MRRHTVAMADGTPLAVQSFGEYAPEATALLLVHGWARAAAYWNEVAAMLGRQAFVVVPDLRMHGDSLDLRSDGVEVSVPLLVDDMRQLLSSLAVSDCVAIGHSMGGQVVTLLAEAAPQLVRGTIAFDPAYGALPDEIAAAEVRRREHVAGAVSEYAAKRPDVDSVIVQRYADALAKLYDSEYLLPHSIGAVEATEPVLRRRSVPSLTVYSSDIGVRTERSLTANAAVTPRVIRWPYGGGHDFPAAHPGVIATLIAEWIESDAAVR